MFTFSKKPSEICTVTPTICLVAQVLTFTGYCAMRMREICPPIWTACLVPFHGLPYCILLRMREICPPIWTSCLIIFHGLPCRILLRMRDICAHMNGMSCPLPWPAILYAIAHAWNMSANMTGLSCPLPWPAIPYSVFSLGMHDKNMTYENK